MSNPFAPFTMPEAWWRILCWIGTTRIAVCGDLPANAKNAREQLAEWVEAGITHIVDLRGECSDERFVAQHAPHITYLYLGTHDDGGAQDPRWFEEGVRAILAALTDPDARVVVHCHMGVNRAPSLAFAALLGLGHEPIEALDAIRAARPIAAILYAESAIEWWAARGGVVDRADTLSRVADWHDENPVDIGWIINRIRVVEADDHLRDVA